MAKQLTTEDPNQGTDQSTDWIFNNQNGTFNTEKVKQAVNEKLQQSKLFTDLLDKIEDAENNTAMRADMIQKIVDAKTEDIEKIVNSTGKDLKTIIEAVTDRCMTFGEEFIKLRELNKTEQGVLDEAARRLKQAESNAVSAKALGDWTNIWFGYKDKQVIKTTQALEDQKVASAEAKDKAMQLYRARVRESSLKEGMDMFIKQTQQAISILSDSGDSTEVSIEKVDGNHQRLLDVLKKTAAAKTKLQEQLTQAKSALDLEMEKDKKIERGTTAAADQATVIRNAQAKYDDLNVEFQRMLAIHNSKERLSVVEQIHITSLKAQLGSIRELAAGLRSDLEERVEIYNATIKAIQNSQITELSSQIKEAGDETDKQTAVITASIASSVSKDQMDRLNRFPEKMKTIGAVKKAVDLVVEHADEFRKKYQGIIDKGYGDAPIPADAPDGPPVKKDLADADLSKY